MQVDLPRSQDSTSNAAAPSWRLGKLSRTPPLPPQTLNEHMLRLLTLLHTIHKCPAERESCRLTQKDGYYYPNKPRHLQQRCQLFAGYGVLTDLGNMPLLPPRHGKPPEWGLPMLHHWRARFNLGRRVLHDASDGRGGWLFLNERRRGVQVCSVDVLARFRPCSKSWNYKDSIDVLLYPEYLLDFASARLPSTLFCLFRPAFFVVLLFGIDRRRPTHAVASKHGLGNGANTHRYGGRGKGDWQRDSRNCKTHTHHREPPRSRRWA